MNQKKTIKENYLKNKKPSIVMSQKQVANQKASPTQIKESSETKEQPQQQLDQEEAKKEYFKKITTKTPAELALEAGRNYILLPEKKKKKPKPTYKKLDMDLLNQIEHDLLNNLKPLSSHRSMERLDYFRKFDEESDLFREAKNERHSFVISKSNPNLFDFDEYKSKQDFKSSKWYFNTDDFYDNEREWVRDIWNEWFDEVIPQLEKTSDDEKMKKKNNFASFDINRNRRRARASLKPVETVEEEDFDMDIVIEDEENRVLKSPTPYETYDTVEVGDSGEKLNLEARKILEEEIDKLNKRMNAQLTAFDLCRRGTLNRKLGLLKLALDDINGALRMEPNFVDAYWQRHLIHFVQNRKDEALDDLNVILKINRAHSGAYLSR